MLVGGLQKAVWTPVHATPFSYSLRDRSRTAGGEQPWGGGRKRFALDMRPHWSGEPPLFSCGPKAIFIISGRERDKNIEKQPFENSFHTS